MRAPCSLWLLSSLLLLLSSFSAAWPWPPFGTMIGRRDDSSSASGGSTTQNSPSPPPSNSPSGSPSPTGSSGSGTITPGPSSSSGSAPSSTSGSDSGSGSSSTTGSDSGSASASSDSAAASTTSIDPRLPAGGIQMITPAVVSGSHYYRIGNNVTFVWNYTSLSVTPSAIDILASCSENNQYYTIALNQSVNATGSATWDTNAYTQTASVNLLTETYTLVIHDAAKSVTATAQAGYLGTYNQFTFGMYLPQPYTDLDQYTCATCSGALSDLDRHALKFVFAMCAVTILSFTWFAGGLGVF